MSSGTAPTDLPFAAPEASPVDATPALGGASPYVVAHVRELMGMPISIQVRGPAPRSALVAEAVAAAYDDLAWVDATFSRWKPDSELSRLRRGELSLDECCPEMAQVLAGCARAAEETEGAFAWVLPDEDSGVWLVEPTGFVKGWAIDRAAAILARVPDHAYCVNAGGDIAVGGRDASPGGDRPWHLGIEDPDQPGQVARVVSLRTGGLATSGCAARGAHLVDPRTGTRVLQRGSVSVVAPEVTWADVWATALFVGHRGLEEHLAGREGWEVIRL